MFFNKVIVKLEYKKENETVINNALGQPLSNISEAQNKNLIYILKDDSALQVITQKNAITALQTKQENQKIYALRAQAYADLTEGLEPILNPMVTDRLGIRLASSFVGNMAKLIAFFLTASLMPVINIVAVPLVFAFSYFLIHVIRYRVAFHRWPNKREFEHMLGQALAAGMEMTVAMTLFTLISGASIFVPISVHVLSILGLPFGGPLITYVVAPLLIATIIAAGTTLFNLARVTVNHFFDVRFHFSSKFPFFFTTRFKHERDSLKELGKKLLVTAVKEFVSGFITSLISVYLSYIPGALLAGYLSAPAVSAATTAFFTLSMQFMGTLVNSLIIALTLDKLFDNYLTPKLSASLNIGSNPVPTTTAQAEATESETNNLETKPLLNQEETVSHTKPPTQTPGSSVTEAKEVSEQKGVKGLSMFNHGKDKKQPTEVVPSQQEGSDIALDSDDESTVSKNKGGPK